MKTTNQIAAFAVLLALTGCNPSSTPDRGKQPESGSTGAVMELPKESAPVPPPVIIENKHPVVESQAPKVETAAPPSDSKETFVASMEQKLKDFDAKIDELVKRSEGYKDDAKVQADQVLAALREQRAKLNTQ